MAKCSALTGEGVPQVWERCQQFAQTMRSHGALEHKRALQGAAWAQTQLIALLSRVVADSRAVAVAREALHPDISSGRVTPRGAARSLLRALLEEGFPTSSVGDPR